MVETKHQYVRDIRVMHIRKPSVLAISLTVMGVVIFCSLGVWQLRRAEYKKTVLARFHQAAHASLVSLSKAVTDRHSGDYPHVKISGFFESDNVYLLENQIRADQLGVMVYVPFHPVGTRHTLLVNLGFLANRGPGATRLPKLPAMPDHKVALTGIYAPPPPPGLKLGGNPLVRQKSWPKKVTWLDPQEIAADLKQTVYPHVLLLDPAPESAYRRDWSANISMPPARHLAYALQWFTFAAAAIVIFIVMHRPKTQPDDVGKED